MFDFKTKKTRFGLAGIGAALMLLTGQVQAQPQQVDVGTMSQGSISYATGSAIAQVLQEKAGYVARVQPNSGESTLIPLIDQGELDIGIANILEGGEAARGEAAFQGRPQENLRALTVLFPLRVALFVRADSDIKTIADLRGKRVTTGYTAMGSIDKVLGGILANGGLSVADVQQVEVPNVVRGADDFAAGRADAFFFGIGAAKVQEVDAAVGGIRALPVDTSEAAVQAMQEIFPYGYPIQVQPTPGMSGIQGPTTAMGYDNLLLVGAHVPDETAAKIAATIAENKDALVAISAQFRGFDRNKMYKDLPLPYHPGVIKWFEEQGIAKAE